MAPCKTRKKKKCMGALKLLSFSNAFRELLDIKDLLWQNALVSY